MENALDKALANASLNAKMNGDSLHTENLDSIADPALDQPQSIAHHTLLAADEITAGWNKLHSPKKRILEEPHLYQQMMETEYAEKAAGNNATTTSVHHLSVLTQAISDKTNWMQQHLIDLTTQVSRIETTITTAAQSMPQEPNHKHRSLHEWDDQYLVNELVERENDLMPFYYELLKRIGSPELQSLVMSSMQGKNNSMVTLAQLCAALGAMTVQPRSQVQAQSIPEIEHQRLEQMSPLERQNFAQQMNTVIPKSPYFETPPTYNPYFKER